ncbi:hypothetical protein IQ241_23625 [Romeria aff. gracilis LEGE 07310]|uniref:Uncharacterized protein n=1 Tax=Vasconcelosia minhoensis LEGE 07310 TaxID=915328 RepID=A0A8J7DNV1_9CYAN|nr:hypothetical protein [Romeria gracilis]MBE9080241.1 hypothetical protein [Romeria aff. gracilis LEGE 07310]
MATLLHFLRSLAITLLVSFLIPLSGLGLLLGLLNLGQLSPAATASSVALQQMLTFLSVFGGGDPVQGIVVIGLAASLVGGLFDAFAAYKHPNLPDLKEF